MCESTEVDSRFYHVNSGKFCIKESISKLWNTLTVKCFMMSMFNLAEPNWMSINCKQKLLTQIICIKDVIFENSTFNKKDKNKYICASNAILVYDMCYEFHWVSNISSPEYFNKYSNVDIMIFKYIFEAIALESKHLSAFVKRNISMLNTVTFIRHLDTVTFQKNIAVKRFLIHNSEKYLIDLGIHTFTCSKGSNILFKYVCDGILDCPDDTSDEDSCMCNVTSQTKLCKTVIFKKNLTLCSSVYYMTKNGHCLKYTNLEKIYKVLNIIHDLLKYRTRVTSKLAAFNKSENNCVQEGIGKSNCTLAINIAKYSSCVNLGELPCGKDHDECFNVTSMCIYQLDFNNELIPCKNGRHLEHCTTFFCDSLLKCTNAYCVPFSRVCNGKWDCPHGDDESKCNKSEACRNMFHCRSTAQLCLHLGNACDGHNDCPLGDDEMQCEMKLVYCPANCICLLYAIDCTALSTETFKMLYPFSYLFVHLSKFTLISMNRLISLLEYAIVILLPKNEISSICDSLNTISESKCIILDLSFNLLKSIESKCFSQTKFLKSLKINDNSY